MRPVAVGGGLRAQRAGSRCGVGAGGQRRPGRRVELEESGWSWRLLASPAASWLRRLLAALLRGRLLRGPSPSVLPRRPAAARGRRRVAAIRRTRPPVAEQRGERRRRRRPNRAPRRAARHRSPSTSTPAPARSGDHGSTAGSCARRRPVPAAAAGLSQPRPAPAGVEQPDRDRAGGICPEIVIDRRRRPR